MARIICHYAIRSNDSIIQCHTEPNRTEPKLTDHHQSNDSSLASVPYGFFIYYLEQYCFCLQVHYYIHHTFSVLWLFHTNRYLHVLPQLATQLFTHYLCNSLCVRHTLFIIHFLCVLWVACLHVVHYIYFTVVALLNDYRLMVIRLHDSTLIVNKVRMKVREASIRWATNMVN